MVPRKAARCVAFAGLFCPATASQRRATGRGCGEKKWGVTPYRKYMESTPCVIPFLPPAWSPAPATDCWQAKVIAEHHYQPKYSVWHRFGVLLVFSPRCHLYPHPQPRHNFCPCKCITCNLATITITITITPFPHNPQNSLCEPTPLCMNSIIHRSHATRHMHRTWSP